MLVKMLPVYDEKENPLKLTIVDNKKHWEHKTRRGEVVAVADGVTVVKPGQVVWFEGAAGFTFDYDPENTAGGDETTHRWLKPHECLAVEEAA